MFLKYLTDNTVRNEIANSVPNGVLQGLLVYSIILVLYKTVVTQQVDKYITGLTTKLYSNFASIFLEFKLAIVHGTGSDEELQIKINQIEKKIKNINQNNKEINDKIFNIALILVYVYVGLFVLSVVLIYFLGGSVDWVGFLFGGFLTIAGATYEYYFITVVILKYNFLSIEKIYVALLDNFIEYTKQIMIIKGHDQEVVEYVFKDLDSKSYLENSNRQAGVKSSN